MILLWGTFLSFLSSQEAYSEGCWGDKSSLAEMLKVHGYLYSTRPVAATMHLHTAAMFLGKRTRKVSHLMEKILWKKFDSELEKNFKYFITMSIW